MPQESEKEPGELERLTVITSSINNDSKVGDFFPSPETTQCSGENCSSVLSSFQLCLMCPLCLFLLQSTLLKQYSKWRTRLWILWEWFRCLNMHVWCHLSCPCFSVGLPVSDPEGRLLSHRSYLTALRGGLRHPEAYEMALDGHV